MAYRAQFPMPTPAGFRDEPYEYYFDDTNTPSLDFSTLTVGQEVIINFSLDVGPDFMWRSCTIVAPTGGGVLGVQFLDGDGHFLSSAHEPIAFFAGLNVDAETNGSFPGEVLEPEVWMRSGSIIQMRIKRLA